ncbi:MULTISPECIES: hypothetical protein [unclassified Moorena]|uniref:hypothetical protein n=1 Tax=unclassified Moorena TaxID=2683338 RepID=UPI0013CBA0AC|nr:MULTISPECIES: hypothetical protein [unclassified Moorena]NEO23825.1 hypothetical protein [Moorena sp. SIO4A5]NEP22106.1 hypothetical protein [Moorena sp. SIO3I6]NEQ61286.1 hypothetical protein [Moorena sp. SIO4A1]
MINIIKDRAASLFVNYYSRFPIPDSRFPIPDSLFPIPDSRFPIPDSRLLEQV